MTAVVHNAEAFNAAVAAFAAHHVSGASIREIQQKIALDALAKLTLYSPVDTGYLRFNWQLTVGQPAAGTKGEEGGEYPDAKAGLLDPEEERAVSELPPFAVVFVTNNAEYAEFVNNGTDRMRAHLMLERTVSDLTEELLSA